MFFVSGADWVHTQLHVAVQKLLGASAEPSPNGMATDWDEPRGAVLKPIARLLARNATKWIAQARGQAMAGSFAEAPFAACERFLEL